MDRERLRIALTEGALADGARRFDPQLDLLLAQATPNPIHTRIVSGEAHRILDSALYALALLERGDRDTAERILCAVIDRQDSDAGSPTYGLWSYWAEEPLEQMTPPDWNFADFIGEVIALILFRHSGRLSPASRAAAETALRHAARSIMRRDVSLDYTNIAAKGAFVTLAAGHLLSDAEASTYGTDRVLRLRDRVARAGSFVEFNSPPYWHVTMKALAGIRQYLGEAGPLAAVRELERLSWRHFLARWHPRLGRLSGPMARCYDTDLRLTTGVLVIVQSADPEHWQFFDEHTLPERVDGVHDAVLDFAIDDDLAPLLYDSEQRAPTVHEAFALNSYRPDDIAASASAESTLDGALVVPSVGTTWFDEFTTLGSVNHSDTWLQRRVLLGTWAESADRPDDAHPPLRAVTAEVVRDGRGFASGSFASVQHDGDLLWSFGLCSPGGDGHPVLDAIDAAESRLTSQLAVRFNFCGLADATAEVVVDGVPLAVGACATVGELKLRTATVAIDWSLALAVSRGRAVTATATRLHDRVVVSIPWFAEELATQLRMSSLGVVAAAGSLRLRSGARHPHAERPRATIDGELMHVGWTVTDARAELTRLELTTAAAVATRFEHAARFAATATHGVAASRAH